MVGIALVGAELSRTVLAIEVPTALDVPLSEWHKKWTIKARRGLNNYDDLQPR